MRNPVNDVPEFRISAIGAHKAPRERKLRVPEGWAACKGQIIAGEAPAIVDWFFGTPADLRRICV